MNNFIPINLKILAKWTNSQDNTKYQNEIRRNRSVSNPITITETSPVLKCFPPRKMDTLANSTKFVIEIESIFHIFFQLIEKE